MFASFMINAWIVASLVAIVAGAVGFFVVLRGSSFAAHALPLCAFPGAAAAHLWGIPDSLGLCLFSGLGVLGITLLSSRQRNEVATALTFVMMLGLGALFLSMARGYSQQVYALLFGEVLGISDRAIAPVAGASGVVLGLTLALFRPLLLSSVSADLAQARGISSRHMDLLFLTILALATTMALPVVGALLVFTLMVGPPAAARFLSDRPLPALLISVAIALATVWTALAASYLVNWPVGFFVGVLSPTFYGLGRCWAWARTRRRLVLREN
jgi:zinc/manganese transport system permease protein